MGPPWRGTWIAGSSDSELHARDVRPWRVSARSATVGRVNVGPANIGSAAVGAPSRKPRERSGWRAVAVPAEHGGWGGIPSPRNTPAPSPTHSAGGGGEKGFAE